MKKKYTYGENDKIMDIRWKKMSPEIYNFYGRMQRKEYGYTQEIQVVLMLSGAKTTEEKRLVKNNHNKYKDM